MGTQEDIGALETRCAALLARAERAEEDIKFVRADFETLHKVFKALSAEKDRKQAAIWALRYEVRDLLATVEALKTASAAYLDEASAILRGEYGNVLVNADIDLRNILDKMKAKDEFAFAPHVGDPK